MLAKVPAAAPVPNSVERGLRTGPAVPPEAYPSWTVNAYDLDLEGMRRLFDEWSLPAYRAQQVFAGLWAREDTYEEMTDLPGALRRRLDAELPAQLEVLTERSADRRATRKALLRVGGRHVIESVLMGYRDRVTVCVSTQVGCAMGCVFCATGQMGLEGNLTAGEIAAQVVWANRAARSLPEWMPRRVTNVVFMGMGEPLANYRATAMAIVRLQDPAGIGLGARHVTVSTVGLVPGIRRLGMDHPQVGLAISLHAADDELRTSLVPPNRWWPLLELEAAVAEWRERTGRRPSIEWTMIDGTNDDDRQAGLLAATAGRLAAHVNLIPMNSTPGSALRPSPGSRVRAFAGVLGARGVTVTVRHTRGRTLDAACGQLRLDVGDGAAQHGAPRAEAG